MVKVAAIDVRRRAVGDRQQLLDARPRAPSLDLVQPFAQGLGDDASHRLASGACDPLREPVGLRILDVEAHRQKPFASFASSSTFLDRFARVVHDLGRDGSRSGEEAGHRPSRAGQSRELRRKSHQFRSDRSRTILRLVARGSNG